MNVWNILSYRWEAGRWITQQERLWRRYFFPAVADMFFNLTTAAVPHKGANYTVNNDVSVCTQRKDFRGKG